MLFALTITRDQIIEVAKFNLNLRSSSEEKIEYSDDQVWDFVEANRQVFFPPPGSGIQPKYSRTSD